MTKRILLLIAFLLLSFPVGATTQWCEHANIETCWNIETGSGTTWDDQSSNNIDATLDVGDPAFNADVPDSGDGFNGTSTYSMDFDGNDGMIASYAYDGNTANTTVLWSVIDGYTQSDRWFSYNDSAGHGFQYYYYEPNWWGNGNDL